MGYSFSPYWWAGNLSSESDVADKISARERARLLSGRMNERRQRERPERPEKTVDLKAQAPSFEFSPRWWGLAAP